MAIKLLEAGCTNKLSIPVWTGHSIDHPMLCTHDNVASVQTVGENLHCEHGESVNRRGMQVRLKEKA